MVPTSFSRLSKKKNVLVAFFLFALCGVREPSEGVGKLVVSRVGKSSKGASRNRALPTSRQGVLRRAACGERSRTKRQREIPTALSEALAKDNHRSTSASSVQAKTYMLR